MFRHRMFDSSHIPSSSSMSSSALVYVQKHRIVQCSCAMLLFCTTRENIVYFFQFSLVHCANLMTTISCSRGHAYRAPLYSILKRTVFPAKKNTFSSTLFFLFLWVKFALLCRWTPRDEWRRETEIFFAKLLWIKCCCVVVVVRTLSTIRAIAAFIFPIFLLLRSLRSVAERVRWVLMW